MFFTRLVSELDNNSIKYAITGGYAVALHGVVRATIDIDLILMLTKESFEKFALIMKKMGLVSRVPVNPSELIEFREDYILKRNLIAWSFVNFKDPSQVVDVLLTEDLKKIKTTRVTIGNLKVNIVTVSELIRMKQISARPQDLIDIENLKKL